MCALPSRLVRFCQILILGATCSSTITLTQVACLARPRPRYRMAGWGFAARNSEHQFAHASEDRDCSSPCQKPLFLAAAELDVVALVVWLAPLRAGPFSLHVACDECVPQPEPFS